MPDVEWAYQTELYYKCAPARAFNVSGTIQQSVSMSCGWDKQWTPADTLPHCSWTHCEEPPEPAPVNFTQLERVWDGEMVELDVTINYTCIRRQKFLSDFGLDKQEATCRRENKWDTPPQWLQCVESKSPK